MVELKPYPYDIEILNLNQDRIFISKEQVFYNTYGIKNNKDEFVEVRSRFPIMIDNSLARLNNIPVTKFYSQDEEYTCISTLSLKIINSLDLKEYPKEFKTLIYNNIKGLI